MDTFIAIGYGSGMNNIDMNIIEFDSSNGSKVYDSYSKGYTFPSEDIKLGGTNDIKNINFKKLENGQSEISFERAFFTGDTFDKELNPNTLMNVSLAWGKGKLSYHGANKKIVQMIIPENDPPSPIDPSDDTGSFDFWQFHGIIMTTLWSGFAFVGYLFSRFFKHLSWWIWMHHLGSGVTALFSIGVLSVALRLSKKNDKFI